MLKLIKKKKKMGSTEKRTKVVLSKKGWRKRSCAIQWQDWILSSFMTLCLIFHTAILINRKKWRITIKLYFENLSIFLKKRAYTHARAKTPPPPVCFCSFAFQWRLLPPLNEPTFWMIPKHINGLLKSVKYYTVN